MKLRFVHNVFAGPAVDIAINRQIIFSNIAYKDVSDYIKVKLGDKVEVSTGGTVILKTEVSNKEKYQTLIIAGLISDLKTITGLFYTDNDNCPSYGDIKIRFIHAAAGLPAVDFFIGSDRIFNDIKYKTGTEYYKTNAGKYVLNVTLAGTINVVVGPVQELLGAGTVITIIATGSVEDPAAIIINEKDNLTCDKFQDDFNVNKYLGKWFEISRIPQFFDSDCPRQTAEYSLLTENSIKVFNTCYDKNWNIKRTITGQGVIADADQPASLTVSFPNFPPPAGANYLVHKTNYKYAVVGSPDRSNLYILNREKKMSKEEYEKLLKFTASLGYDNKKLVLNYNTLE